MHCEITREITPQLPISSICEIVRGFCIAFKFGRRVHSALRCKILKPPIAFLPAIVEVERWRACQERFNTVLADFSAGQFKLWMKKWPLK